MNGIIQEQKTLPLNRTRKGLATAPPWFGQNGMAADQSTRQIFLDTTSLESDFAAEREHEHWGLNE